MIIESEHVNPVNRNCGISWDPFSSADVWRDRQAALMAAGDSAGAVYMDIEDVRTKFGTKYDDAIMEMLSSIPIDHFRG